MEKRDHVIVLTATEFNTVYTAIRLAQVKAERDGDTNAAKLLDDARVAINSYTIER